MSRAFRMGNGTGARFALCCAGVMLQLALLSVARGDGEPAAWVGSSLRPVDSDSIRMVRERVVIELSPVTALVKATFVFRNEGDARDQIVAFPAGEHITGTRNFRAWIDGREVEVGAQDYGPALHYWTVPFAAGGSREVRVRYDTRRDTSFGDALAEGSFSYILRTGRRWKGPIGSAEIVLNLRDITHDQITGLGPPGYGKTRTGYRWLLRNIEPEENVWVQFRGSPLKLVFRSAGGGERLHCGYPPLPRGKTMLISLRTLRSVCRFKREWDSTTKTFTARRGPLVVRCRVGSRRAFLGDREIRLRAAPEIRDSRLMIPIELAEPLGLRVLYKPHTNVLFLRQLVFNADAVDEPDYAVLHLAPRRYFMADYERERKRLQARLRTAPASLRPAVRFKLGDIAYYCGEWKQAEEHYAQVPEQAASYPWARWWQGKCMQRQGRPAEALRLFAAEVHKAVGLRPLSQSYLRLSALEAIRCVTQHAGVPSEDMPLAIAAAREAENIGSISFRRRLWEEMITLFAKAQQQGDMLLVADRLISSGPDTDPDLRPVLLGVAETCGWLKGETRSLSYWLADRLQGSDLEETFLAAAARAEWHMAASEKAAQTHDLLISRFAESEDLPRYLLHRAKIAGKLGGREAFKDKCWALITAHPAAAWRCAEEVAEYATQEQLIWMADNMPRPPQRASLFTADLRYLHRRYDSALRLYEAFGIGGDFRSGLHMKSTVMAALCYLQAGDAGRASELFQHFSDRGVEYPYQEIIAEGPDSEAGYEAIARCWLRYPSWETGRAILRRGIEEHPQSARIRYAFGKLCWWEWDWAREKEKDQALHGLLLSGLREWETALEIDPNLESCRLDLSKAYCALARRLEDPQEKRHYYQQAVAHWNVTVGRKPEDSIRTTSTPDYLDAARAYLY